MTRRIRVPQPRTIARLGGLAACLLALAAGAWAAEPASARGVPARPAHADGDAPGARRPAFGHVPMSFEPNRGQAGPGTQFMARGRGYGVFLQGPDAVVALTRTDRAAAEPERIRPADRILVRMALAGANRAAAPAALGELPGKVNYLVGSDPAKWRTGVPTYRKVR